MHRELRLIALSLFLFGVPSRARAHAEPVAVVFVVDVSRSMRDAMPDVGDVIEGAVHALERRDVMGIVTFDSAAQLWVEPQTRSYYLVHMVAGLKAGRGGTDLVVGLDLGLATLKALPRRRQKRIVLVTDAIADVSGLAAFAERAAAARVRVTVMSVWREQHGETMRALAERTGGDYVVLADVAQRALAFRDRVTP